MSAKFVGGYFLQRLRCGIGKVRSGCCEVLFVIEPPEQQNPFAAISMAAVAFCPLTHANSFLPRKKSGSEPLFAPEI